MKSHTRVVVIGGGVVGCSVLYHLTKLGWSDVTLIERSDLTSGSTWHAAGGFHTINGDTTMAALQGYTIRLYKELEAITGMSCGLHHVGGVTLADNEARFEQLKAERAKHRYMGLDTEILSPEEISKLTDGLVNTKGLLGGLYDPLDGHHDPSGPDDRCQHRTGPSRRSPRLPSASRAPLIISGGTFVHVGETAILGALGPEIFPAPVDLWERLCPKYLVRSRLTSGIFGNR